MSQSVFERIEKKYLLTPMQYEELRMRLEGHMKVDAYGLHTISNIYFDTDSYELIRTSLQKPIYKEKFRLRSYGIPKKGDTVFLELKKKYKGVVYKRRVPMEYQEAMEYLEERENRNQKSQILSEIDWFFRKYRPTPKAYIAYDRMALYGIEDENLRITFDRNIRWRDYDLELAKGDEGSPLLQPEQYLMEIKIPGTMPLWLVCLLTELDIYSSSFSKYGTCYQRHLLNKHLGGQNIAS